MKEKYQKKNRNYYALPFPIAIITLFHSFSSSSNQIHFPSTIVPSSFSEFSEMENNNNNNHHRSKSSSSDNSVYLDAHAASIHSTTSSGIPFFFYSKQYENNFLSILCLISRDCIFSCNANKYIHYYYCNN